MRGVDKIAAFLLGALVAIGCAGPGEDPVGASEALIAEAALPLPVIEQSLWEATPAGCEGQLGHATEFGIAEAQPELVVAFDEMRVPLCVDTYSAIESELQIVDSELSESLWLGYMTSLEVEPYARETSTYAADHRGGPRVDVDTSVFEGDPNPQPNGPAQTLLGRDAAEDGDPNPQPNRPTGDRGGMDMGGDEVDMEDDVEPVSGDVERVPVTTAATATRAET